MFEKTGVSTHLLVQKNKDSTTRAPHRFKPGNTLGFKPGPNPGGKPKDGAEVMLHEPEVVPTEAPVQKNCGSPGGPHRFKPGNTLGFKPGVCPNPGGSRRPADRAASNEFADAF
ncbi:MAG: hypothetical protein ACJ8C9_07840 [Microvirga sp.]